MIGCGSQTKGRRCSRLFRAVSVSLAVTSLAIGCNPDPPRGESRVYDAGSTTEAKPVECGAITCAPDQYCVIRECCRPDAGGPGTTTYSCEPVPAGCDPRRPCACDNFEPCPTASCLDPRKLTCSPV